mgnify:CR=1 FL=1
MEVSVRDLKDHLSEYLRRARAGEEVLVTSHGKPVGRLVGPYAGGSAPEMDAVARLSAQPWIRAGTTDELVDWVRGE